MRAYLNRIDGIDDALTAITLTRRNWSREDELKIRRLVYQCTDPAGRCLDLPGEEIQEYNDRLKVLLKHGAEHITLLSFIDLSITTEGMHRAGQDDVDAHAYRYHNRIIRMSTRAKNDVFTEPEVSDYYKNKIIPTDVALGVLGIKTPDTLEYRGKKYVKTVNGYVMEDYAHVQDAKRGLYMLSIPSNFILRCNLKEWAHVYQMRNESTWAHPEVKEWAESVSDQLNNMQPLITKDYLKTVRN